MEVDEAVDFKPTFSSADVSQKRPIAKSSRSGR